MKTMSARDAKHQFGRLIDTARAEPVVGLCCTDPVWDSSHESSVVAGLHEQTHAHDLQDQELASLQ